MVTRILVPMDDSEMAERALEFALGEHPDAEITVLHVAGGPSPMMGGATAIALEDGLEERAREAADVVFDRARELAAEHDHEVETDLAFGSPAKAIVEEAESFDLVVMGSHSGSLSDRLFTGNVAEKVFRHSPVPVTSVR